EEVLREMGVPPDCEFSSAAGKPKMAWIHRVVDDVDIYFVSNQRPYGVNVDCTFRVSGRAPSFWRPDTGAMVDAPLWSEAEGRTTVPIQFDPAGSVFVVFERAATSGEHFVSIVREGQHGKPEPAPHIEIKKAVYEAVDGAGGVDVTAKVAALVKAGEGSIPAN